MKYILPDKSLLEKRSSELTDKKYYNLSKLLYKKDFHNKLMIPIGIDETKEEYFLDLNDVSGLFISGETGSGKSVFLNSVVISLLMKNAPDELKFVFIDPRGVEFNNYSSLPHLLDSIKKEKTDSLVVLKKVLSIIEKRRELFIEKSVKNIESYNLISEERMPHILIFIDEASQILESSDFDDILKKYLMEGYKFGIHLVLATSIYFNEFIDEETLKLFKYIITFDLATKEQAKFLKMDDSNWLTISGDALVKIRNNKIKLCCCWEVTGKYQKTKYNLSPLQKKTN